MNPKFEKLNYAGRGLNGQDPGNFTFGQRVKGIVLSLKQAGSSGLADKRGGREEAEKKCRVLGPGLLYMGRAPGKAPGGWSEVLREGS